MIKLSTLKPDPHNPRKIADKGLQQLIKSLKDFPKMMELRPIIIDENNIVKAGNQRLKALKKLGYKEVPDEWIKKAMDFTPQQLREFMLKDNDHAGEYDWDILNANWNIEEITEWGLSEITDQPEREPPSNKEKVSFVKTNSAFIKITFKNPKQLQKAEPEIKALLENHKGAIYKVSAAGKAGL